MWLVTASTAVLVLDGSVDEHPGPGISPNGKLGGVYRPPPVPVENYEVGLGTREGPSSTAWTCPATPSTVITCWPTLNSQ